uniref:Uncharacterized protein n=1 Tax=Erpetoichthys calabaricus TaxID=27687 RepID=A0A8C4XCW1_ERPCA
MTKMYKEDYIGYGFISSGPEDAPLPLCLICNSALSNEALVPSKLKRHLETKHPAVKAQPKEYFENIRAQQNKQAKKLTNYLKLPEKGLIASYKVAQLLAKRKKAHTEAESVIAPALAIAVETILGPDAAEKVKKVPLSNDTISRRIEDLSSDLQDQICEHFDAPDDEVSLLWSLQVDESTDVSGKAQLLAFIRFIKDEKCVNEFLFCKDLQTTTKGEDIFNVVNENILLFKLQWKNCVSVCTDGCPSMQGNRKGFVTLVRQENPNVLVVHCMIHREALDFKSLPKDLMSVLDQVITVVNFIKSRPLASRLFSQLCEAMDSDYKCLLYHTNVRWLSRGKVLKCVVQLKAELISFLEAEKKDFGFFIHDEIWWVKVTFLSDLFDKLNSLNLSLQGPSENIITASSKLKSFGEKLSLWQSKISKGVFDCFPTYNECASNKEITPEILYTLTHLQSALQHYFPTVGSNEYGWVSYPFGNNEATNLTTEEEEQLIDLKNDAVLKSSFAEKSLDVFWISINKLYPAISLKAIKIILPFASSWFCEFGFSALTEIKSKKRERLLTIDAEMRVCLSTLEPRLDCICSQKQAHPSH